MNRVKTVFLMTALAGILMAIGGLIGGRSGVMVMFLIATGMNFISYWFSDSMVLKAYRAQEVGEDHYLYRIVADLAQRAELPMPKVYIIPTEVPNAFATGRSPSHAAVAATAGILDLLDEDEIRHYVISGEPMDKAGAYGIQGRAGMFVEHLAGSYTGVMGLPVCETSELLKRLGFRPL